jgi:NTP pyrophosphatase (non-canonical NTP hydrolase)
VHRDVGDTDINGIVEECGRDSEAWFPDLAQNTFFMAAAAAGEIGEVLNLLKKVERGTHSPDDVTGQVVNEAMDAIIYLLCLLDIEGQDFVALYDAIRRSNVGRFGVSRTTPEG